MPELPSPTARITASRRQLLAAGTLGVAALGMPLGAAALPRGFTHGVASGEPGADRVLLWTRFVAAADSALRWEVADSADFARVVSGGTVNASPASDGCAKAWATGLNPGSWYFYRFIAPDGSLSDVGRTRTLPSGKVARFRIAVFSCSNLGFGFFNAYAHAAEAGDFDLAMHLGDYFYEYHRGEYPSAKQVMPGRESPLDEAVTLAGYRDRFAAYRSDPDLQRIHQVLPMIAMWDDHEVANDTWEDGAENHQPGEGDWQTRKRLAEQAYREWMPVSDDYYAKYEIGDLATLFRLESRHLARSKQLDLLGTAKAAAPGAVDAALRSFRDGAWQAVDRTLLGVQQEAWLGAALKASVKARKPWQVLGQEVVMGSLALPDGVIDGLPATAADWLRQRLTTTVAAAHEGLPYNMDAWDGYPAARDRLYKASLEAGANLVVLSGDSHNAWAFDLDRKGARVGVEMGGHSVTSPGAEQSLAWKQPADLARDLVGRNPQLKWCDTAQRGYMAVELTPTAASSEWRFMAGVRQKGTALAGTKRMTVLAGQRKYSA
ncbi:MAG: alkaline phosphatase D family protein [Novosphingobium sp.]